MGTIRPLDPKTVSNLSRQPKSSDAKNSKAKDISKAVSRALGVRNPKGKKFKAKPGPRSSLITTIFSRAVVAKSKRS
jgi:hypothetical protein